MNRLPFLAALTLLAPACARPTDAAPRDPPSRPRVHVDSVAVVEHAMPATLLLAGSLKANQETDLAANASGRVTRTLVERGSWVGAGGAVAQLDTRLSQLSAAEAQANLEAARHQKEFAAESCARYQQLFERGALSQMEFDRQTSACKTSTETAAAAESRARQAAQMVGDATIRAPFAGLVAERYVAAGEYVRPDTKVAHIVEIDPLRLELTVAEASMGAVRTGQKVEFHVAAFRDRTFTGTVRYIGPSLRAATRDLVFEALVPNRDKLLRPGLFATARLDAGTQLLPSVPRAALRQDGDTWRAFVIVEHHLEERVVQVGPADGDLVAVPSGLKAGERVVARPSEQISDGLNVD
jgi:RND family efflux transporter MFP subunit